MSLTDDSFLISCCTPPEEKARAKWKGRPSQCSVCGSLHPNQFVEALKEGLFNEGFYWGDTRPMIADTEIGQFHAKHLKDMSYEWLKANSLLIAQYTGILFYWIGPDFETFSFKKYGRKQIRGRGNRLTVAIMAKVNEEHKRVFSRPCLK